MRGAFRIAIIGGIEVCIHWSLLVFAAIYFLLPLPVDSVDIGLRAGYIVLLFFSVLLHEFGHSLAARFCDGASDTIVLWPLGGLAYVHLPDSPMVHFLVALAGPLVTVALWLGAHLVSPFTSGWVQMTLFMLVKINWALWLFNLLPAYPMDGGRLLHAVLWRQLGYGRALWICVHMSLVIGGAMLIWTLVDGRQRPELLLASAFAVYILLNAWQQRQMLKFQQVNDSFWSSRPGVAYNHPYRTVTFRPQSWWTRLKSRYFGSTKPDDDDLPAHSMSRERFLKEKIDPILDKISRDGMQSLTKDERKILESAKDFMQKQRR